MKQIILYSILFLGLVIFMGYLHESIHMMIYENYGIESHIEWFSHFPDLVTVTNEGQDVSKCNEQCDYLHTMNEVVGYPLGSIMALMGLGIFFILIKLKSIETLAAENDENEN